MEITTNNTPRDIINAWELSESDRGEFEYLDWPAIDRGEDSRDFVRYQGGLIDLGDVMVIGGTITPQMREAGFHKWDGYSSDSFFSGLVFRWVDDCERVIVGRYCS